MHASSRTPFPFQRELTAKRSSSSTKGRQGNLRGIALRRSNEQPLPPSTATINSTQAAASQEACKEAVCILDQLAQEGCPRTHYIAPTLQQVMHRRKGARATKTLRHTRHHQTPAQETQPWTPRRLSHDRGEPRGQHNGERGHRLDGVPPGMPGERRRLLAH